MIWVRRIALILLVLLVFGISAGALGLRHALRSSLPREVGDLRVAGLESPVTISRDRWGTPAIRGESFLDVCFAQGFIHAQERFFQMDLSRRYAAGELSELMGQSTIGADRFMRRYRFRHVAEEALEQLSEKRRAQLDRYAEGVNAGLADLGARPPEYLLFGQQPQAWTSADTLLVVYSMFDSLNFDDAYERGLDTASRALAPALLEFLTPVLTRYDAPLIGPKAPGDSYVPAPIPGPEVVNVRTSKQVLSASSELREETPGSNNWAIAGDRSAHGGAILANDMHLPLRAPGIWRHDHLIWDDHFVVGASLPGVPGIVVGSNGRLAWGFTNVMADVQDLIVIEVDPADESRYLTPDGSEPFEEIVETIRVRGLSDKSATLRSTRWGVVTGEDPDGRPIVLKWTALMPEIFNLRILDMAFAESIEEAIVVGSEWVGPSQNMVIADDGGRIGWVVTGWLPKRIGFDGSLPVSWADGSHSWSEQVQVERPALLDPASGMLFTANNRTAPPSISSDVGRSWAMGFRAKRIEELLRRESPLAEQDMLEIQLDTRNLAVDFYRDLALELVSADDTDARRRAVREMLVEWNGYAGVDSEAFRFLRGFRQKLHGDILTPLTEPCREIDKGFQYSWLNQEESVRRIVEERPTHMLPPTHATWDDFLNATYDWTVDEIVRIKAENDGDATWGQRNLTRIRHPLADAIPALGWLLNMRDVPVPGSSTTVRVSAPGYGASQRLVVSPGREEQAIFQLPTGVSGHPLSPHYSDRYESWVKGAPAPLLSGEPITTFTLLPNGS